MTRQPGNSQDQATAQVARRYRRSGLLAVRASCRRWRRTARYRRIDAYEDYINAPGSVYLFGKVRTWNGGFAPCCVGVKGSSVYILPRKRPYQWAGDWRGGRVHAALQGGPAALQEQQDHALGCKKVDRHTPSRIRPSPRTPPISSLYTRPRCRWFLSTRPVSTSAGSQTASSASSSSGVSWARAGSRLRRRDPIAHVMVQIRGRAAPGQEGDRSADPPPSPPLVVASLHVQTGLNAKHIPEVLLASVITHQGVSADGATNNPTALSSFSVVRKPEGRAWPWDLQRTVQADKRLKLEICASERALLNYLISKLHNIDADVLVGHNIAAYDLAVLLQRLSVCKVAHWSKIGRMRIKNMPKLSNSSSAFGGSNWAEWSVVAGRLMCDTYLSAKELLPSQRSYGLKELAKVHLSANKPEIEQSQMLNMFEETPTILQLVRLTENDAFLSLQLMFKIRSCL